MQDNSVSPQPLPHLDAVENRAQLAPLLPPQLVADNIARVQARVAAAVEAAGRKPQTVQIMLAAKYQPVENLRAAIAAGGKLLGHNLVQQLLDTEAQLQQIPHFVSVIGHVQANKLSAALENADRIDTVDSLKMAQRIARRQAVRIAKGKATQPFPILLQVNSAQTPTQFGCAAADLIPLAQAILQLPELKIAGLMTIGANTENQAAVARSFAVTQELSAQLRELPGLADATEISMGMTRDLELAIAHGATLVRVGNAVFGARPCA